MPDDVPDPAAIGAILASSPVDDAFETLDRICGRYEASLTLELAEDTYADLTRGIDHLQTATCYVDADLATLKRRLPGTVFSTLPDGHDAYELTRGEATLRLKFGETHGATRSVDAPYATLEIAVPTTEAYFTRVSEALDTERTSTPTARDRQ
ncbi:hypothetical protein SAMN04488065_2034 [Haloplanus vescus]|uniref:Uncharacterized protein n=1 Tax=Haloplanus vescus TaxID=555874 RepID=A0A1H3YR49_9EURY|nr:hypothetical protein [Haloplanus vescus]SEA13661.1 hypothetical protein SAMN04488065_2034 [Haloplanus vescus]